ncbi:MAG: tRNA lysidine(34) synthetase TilS [Prevotellaceae bacterium]|nr:tRNA lysidine(34) synthetase TilS [Prevotellaceae bacterium]
MWMEEKVKSFIAEQNLFGKSDKIIVGISGGADSVALLSVLHGLGYDCVAVHCNFHLRGAESDRDEAFVTEFVERLGMSLYKVDFETEKYATEKKMSIEMAARELRYAWFAEMKEKERAACVAIAHHSDDVVETFLINLTRGTGIHGLTGIKPKNGDIVRPLLCVSRAEVLSYLERKGLSHVEDSTNKDTIYVRNKFRNVIIPLFETINPGFRDSLLRTMENLQLAERFISDGMQERQSEIIAREGDVWRISIDRLHKYGNEKFLLFEMLQPFGFVSAVVDNIYDGLDGRSGSQYYSDRYRVQKDRRELILSRKTEDADVVYTVAEDATSVEVPVRLSLEVKSAADVVLQKDKNNCYVDVSRLQFPLTIRRWRDGDSFLPFGMKGRKKLSDFFVDNHFSLYRKEHTWLLLSGEEIVWIIGERCDNRYRMELDTEKVLEIHYFGDR